MEVKRKPPTPWRAKLEKKQEPKIVDIPPRMVKRFGTGKMLVPTPLLVNDLMHKVEKGKLVTVNQLRERLAKDFKVDSTCPLTTGIFLRIAAETAEEDLSRGESEITPYWRTLKSGGELNAKYPGGVEAQAVRLREEGHIIEPGKGKKPPRVKDFDKFLQEL